MCACNPFWAGERKNRANRATAWKDGSFVKIAGPTVKISGTGKLMARRSA